MLLTEEQKTLIENRLKINGISFSSIHEYCVDFNFLGFNKIEIPKEFITYFFKDFDCLQKSQYWDSTKAYIEKSMGMSSHFLIPSFSFVSKNVTIKNDNKTYCFGDITCFITSSERAQAIAPIGHPHIKYKNSLSFLCLGEGAITYIDLINNEQVLPAILLIESVLNNYGALRPYNHLSSYSAENEICCVCSRLTLCSHSLGDSDIDIVCQECSRYCKDQRTETYMSPYLLEVCTKCSYRTSQGKMSGKKFICGGCT